MEGRVGEEMVFEGLIHDFDKKVSAVKFSLDDGQTWTTYELEGNESNEINWRFAYVPQTPGYYLLKVCAVDDDNEVSDYLTGFAFEVLP